MNAPETVRVQNNPLVGLLDLARRARHAGSLAALRFLLVNDTRSLLPYRQAALWWEDEGVVALSGVVQVEANAPYVQWLAPLMGHCRASLPKPAALEVAKLPAELSAGWDEWLPAHACWVPLQVLGKPPVAGGLLLARAQPWTTPELGLLGEWAEQWQQSWQIEQGASRPSWRQVLGRLRRRAGPVAERPWWQRRSLWMAMVALVVSVIPLRLTVLAPAELVPARPHVMRAPLEGVIEAFHVQPNDMVKAGQLLFQFDEALLRSRLDVARQALMTAEVEYRQVAQQAFQDPRAKALLASLAGKIEERRHEAQFIEGQLGRARVLAPQDGVALLDDPTQWIGRPVAVGEAVMRVAELQDVEVEAWLGVADAIPLLRGSEVTLHLNASPLAPVKASMRYVSHGPVERPDGSYAYRLRAVIDGKIDHRVGLKGTARISGEQVPLIYWALRRPWAALRSWLGW